MMIFSTLVPVLGLIGLGVSASPIEKRYTGVYIVSHRSGRCLSSIPRNGVGAPVFLNDCSNTVTWDINPGSGSVIVSGTQLALDAGSNPGNNGPLKIWTSYPGLYQQTWFLTGDNRIAITGGNQCLDEGPDGIQTYQCTTGNTNQIFTISTTRPGSPSSSSSAAPSSTSSTSPSPSSTPPNGIPVGKVYADPPNGGHRLHVFGRNDLCLTVMGGATSDGAAIGVTYCFDNASPDAKFQLWDVPSSGGSGLVKLHGANYCFDAGSNPSSGTGLKIWTCYNGLYQQTWKYSDLKFTLTNGQAVDVKQESTAGNQKPYNSLKDVQTWQSFPYNSNQQISIYFGN